MKGKLLSKVDRKLGLRRIVMVDVMVHGMDYLLPVTVCMRRQPVLRPNSFVSTSRVVLPRTNIAERRLTLHQTQHPTNDTTCITVIDGAVQEWWESPDWDFSEAHIHTRKEME